MNAEEKSLMYCTLTTVLAVTTLLKAAAAKAMPAEAQRNQQARKQKTIPVETEIFGK
jgi:hypothetical protein